MSSVHVAVDEAAKTDWSPETFQNTVTEAKKNFNYVVIGGISDGITSFVKNDLGNIF